MHVGRLGTSVVEEVDVDVDTVAFGGGTHERANVLRGATSSADDSTEVAVGDANFKDDDAVVVDCFDANRVGVVDDRTDDVVEHFRGNGCLGHDDYFFFVDLVAMNSLHRPLTSSNLRTRSVGKAPLLSHCMTLALSTAKPDGFSSGR